tara:strand:- start:422 stop:862 length:441 start_codon:yes stop_codon:yes gene_type:complete
MVCIFISSCNLNQYQQVNFKDKEYFLTFNKEIPSKIETKIKKIIQSSSDEVKAETFQISINDYQIKRYEVYSGSALRSLETEIKGNLKISIKVKNISLNKNLMAMKRFESIELNPLAETEMLNFMENEIIDDLVGQLILEVNLIDM